MASLIPMILLDGTKGCERLRAGSLTTLNTWLCVTTTESSLSAFLSRLMRRETLRDLRSAPGSRLWHQAPGNKFLRHLGSLCARAHPENNQEGSDIERTKPRRRKNYDHCKPPMYRVPL